MLSDLPNLMDVSSYWQLLMWALMAAVSAVAAGFSAWVKFSTKKLDQDAQHEVERTRIEIEQLKLEFEQRKSFEETLQAAFSRALDEGRRLREELHAAQMKGAAREQVIAELRGTVASLNTRILTLESKN